MTKIKRLIQKLSKLLLKDSPFKLIFLLINLIWINNGFAQLDGNPNTTTTITYKVDSNNPDSNNPDSKIQVSVPNNLTSKEKLKKVYNEFPGSLKNLVKKTKGMTQLIKPWDTMKLTMKQFPLEFIGFQAGVGFLTLLEVMLKYHNNPIAFQQTMDTLLLTNGIGAFSFFAFMYAARLPAPIFTRMMNSNRFSTGKYFPMLMGSIASQFPMFVGMLSSQFSHLIFESLAPCARAILLNNKVSSRAHVEDKWPDACTSAYDNFVLKNSFIQMAPGIISGLLSVPVAGFINNSIGKIKTLNNISNEINDLSDKVISSVKSNFIDGSNSLEKSGISRIINIINTAWNNNLSFISPGAVISIGKSTLVHLIKVAKNAAVFVGADQYIVHPIVNYGWNKLVLEPKVIEAVADIEADLIELNQSNLWSDELINKSSNVSVCRGAQTIDCLIGFPAKIYNFNKIMSEWRQKQLETAQMSHSSWSAKFHKLTSSYEASFKTYNQIIEDIILSKSLGFSPIDRTDFLYGIKPMVESKDERDSLNSKTFRNPKYYTFETRLEHYKNWNNASSLIQEKISEIQTELKKNEKSDWFSKAAETFNWFTSKQKNEPLKEPNLIILDSISKFWSNEDDVKILKNISIFSKSDLTSSSKKTFSNLLKNNCIDKINDQSIKSIVSIKPNERGSTQNTQIMNCLIKIEDKIFNNMLEGARLFSTLTRREKGELEKIPQRIKVALKEINEALGEKTSKLSIGLDPKFDKNHFLDNPGNTDYLQFKALKIGADFIISELKKYNNKDISNNEILLKLQKIAELWTGNLNDSKIVSLNKELNSIINYTNFNTKSELSSDEINESIIAIKESFKAIREDQKLTDEHYKELKSRSIEIMNKYQDYLQYSINYFLKKIDKLKVQNIYEGITLYSELLNDKSSSKHPLLLGVAELVGESNPHKEIGRAYLKNFEIHSLYSDLYAEISFPRNIGAYPITTPAEYFVYQMICGPEVEFSNDSLVQTNKLSYDSFLPPRIRKIDHSMKNFCDSGIFPKWTEFQNKKMYTDTYKINKAPSESDNNQNVALGTKNYEGLMDYLKNNIRDSVIGNIQSDTDEPSQFPAWWDAHVSPQLDKFFDSYAKDYNLVIDSIRNTFKSKGTLKEKNPISKNPIEALIQESRLYLTIINEMNKDLLNGKGINLSTAQAQTHQNDALETINEINAENESNENSQTSPVSPEQAHIQPISTSNNSPQNLNIHNILGQFVDKVELLKIFSLYPTIDMDKLFSKKLPDDVSLNINTENAITKLILDYESKLNEIANVFLQLEAGNDIKEITNILSHTLNELSSISRNIRSTLTEYFYPHYSPSKKAVLEESLNALKSTQIELMNYQLMVTLLNYQLSNKIQQF